MNNRKWVFGVGVAVILVALFSWNFVRGSRGTSQTGSNTGGQTVERTTQTNRDLSGDNDVLVVYFSRTSGVWDGPLEVGHTKVLADYITEATNADQYEIVPAVAYPDDYEATAEQARQEQADDARPAIANPLPDLSEYETIFIGAPVWWSEYPMIVRTFLDGEADQLANKTLVPFTTHLGSGLGASQRQLESQFPQATVLDGFSVRGEDGAVNGAESDVRAWLTRIGVNN
ncbi:flavodoxin [Streptococcus sp. NLN76]|uniref:flavodoxin n=1 Tax=Streptococcus sp. NLN76 TaxID=2822800 RepID=UPI0018A96499|nr:flavodoxin [Streptococcus sp. NLN76]MBF8970009.1 flavodoxin [Streptococcus sp. NLN76]